MATQQPLNVPEGMSLLGIWFDRTFRIWWAHRGWWLLVGGAFTLCVLAGNLAIMLLLGVPFPAGPPDWTTPQLIAFILSRLGLFLALSALCSPSMIVAALKQLRNEPVTLRELLPVMRRWFVPALLALLAAGLLMVLIAALPAVAIGLIAPILGVLVLVISMGGVAVGFFLVLPILVDQQTGPLAALARSWVTVHTHFWRFLFFAGFFFFVLLAVGGQIQSLMPTQNLNSLIWQAIAGAVVIPLPHIAEAVAYEESYCNPSDTDAHEQATST